MKSEDAFGYGSPTVPADALFIECTDPLRLFPSVPAAESAMEAMGIESRDCSIAYGPRGEVYRITTEADRIRIELSDEPYRPGELKALLLHYFECCEDPFDEADELSCLVDEAWAVERRYWLNSLADHEAQARRIPAWALVPLAILIAAGAYLAFWR